MRYPIADAAAITFSREFYRALSTGFAVDAAAADARKGLFLERGEDDRAWLTPVAFMRTPDGRIFEVAD
jgi:catechol 2,3-dioxygenase-like lactoylglutathione lyase family enzyme